MIPISELRIGNLVTIRDNHRHREIVATSKGWVNVSFPCGSHETYPHEKLMPIPLTPEILERFGFEAVDDDGKYRYPDVAGIYLQHRYLADDGCDLYIFKQWIATINSLHQLQNTIFFITTYELTKNGLLDGK